MKFEEILFFFFIFNSATRALMGLWIERVITFELKLTLVTVFVSKSKRL